MTESLPSPKKPIPRAPLLGFAFILLMLCSLPVIALATGAVNGSPQYSIMQRVPERGDGAYLQVNDGQRAGVIQLYPWNFTLNEFPSDAPVFNPRHVTGLVISQNGIDNPARYNLFRVDNDSTIPLDPQTTSTKIYFSFRQPLADGRYMLDMPKSGLSADRQYLYFVIDSRAAALPIRPGDR